VYYVSCASNPNPNHDPDPNFVRNRPMSDEFSPANVDKKN